MSTDPNELNNNEKNDDGAFNVLPNVLLKHIMGFFPPTDPNAPKKLPSELGNLRLASKRLNTAATSVCQNKHGLFKSPFTTTMVQAGEEYFAVSNLSYSSGSYWSSYTPTQKQLAEAERRERQQQSASVNNATHFYLFKTEDEARAFINNLPEAQVMDGNESRMIIKTLIKKNTKLLELSHEVSIRHELWQKKREKLEEYNQAARQNVAPELLLKLETELKEMADKLNDPKQHILSCSMLRAEKNDLQLPSMEEILKQNSIASGDEDYVGEQSTVKPSSIGQQIKEKFESKCIMF